MIAVHEVERIESRALAALRFIDAASSVTVDAPLALTLPPGTEIFRNRSHLYIVRRHAPLAAHSDSFFEAPATPAIASLTLTFSAHDPMGVYLARTVHVSLPRDPRPENAHADDSLFRPVEVELYRSPAASLGANWAALRVSIRETVSGDAIGGALLRVVSNGRILARGLSDWRGEALVPVVGVPVTTWSEDETAVVATEIAATLEVLFDSAAGGFRTPATQLANAIPPANIPPPDPAQIEANPAAARTQTAVSLAAGRSAALALNLDLPG